MQGPPPAQLLGPDPGRRPVREVMLVYRCPDGQPGERDEVENIEEHVEHQHLGDRLEKGRVRSCVSFVL